MESPVTLLINAVDVTAAGAIVHGVIGLGPVAVGDSFNTANDWDHEESVCLQLEDISLPPGAQEVGRTSRVVAVLTGEGIERLRPGLVLAGNSSRPTTSPFPQR